MLHFKMAFAASEVKAAAALAFIIQACVVSVGRPQNPNTPPFYENKRDLLSYMGGNLKGWCQRCYMPRIESVYGEEPEKLPFDFPEILAAIAPRPLYVHAPTRDSNFKVESVKKCIEAAQPVYELLGAEKNLVAAYPPGGHGFPPEAREAAYKFISSKSVL